MTKPKHPHGGPPGQKPERPEPNIIAHQNFGVFPAPPGWAEGDSEEWHRESWEAHIAGRPCLNLGNWTHPSEGLAAAVFYPFAELLPVVYISFLTYISSLPAVRNVEVLDTYCMLTNNNVTPPRSGEQEAGNIYLAMAGHHYLTYGSDSINTPLPNNCPIRAWYRVWLTVDTVTDGGFIQAETAHSGIVVTKCAFAPGFKAGALVKLLLGPMQACEVAYTDFSVSTFPFKTEG